MTEDPAMPTGAPTPEASHRAAAVRGLVVLAAWVATWPLRVHGAPTRLGLDVVLALAGWWAARPGHRHGGPLFGEDGHWTSLLVALPIGFAIAAAAEAWHMLRGTAG
jgi:hypothetical protein